MSATLLYGDCVDKMKGLPDKSVDCFICDLPYGQLASGYRATGIHPQSTNPNQNIHKTVFQTNPCAWDIKIDLKAFWEQVERLAKNDHTPVIHFCNTKFGYELIKSNEKWFRYDLVWNKEHGVSFLSANKMPMKSHEMIYVFSKKGAYYKRIDDKRCALSVITINKSNKRSHPTEKPKELYEWLLQRYCPEGGTVLDPTAGSFNSIDVAKKLGLKGIGIEKDRAFFWKAVGKF